MFNSQRPQNFNSGGGDVNVNTSLLFFSNPDSDCELRTKAWNKQMSVYFAPFVGLREDGIRMYEKDKSRIPATSVSLDNALILLKGFEEKIKPAIESHTEKKISVDIGRDPKKSLSLGYDGKNAYLQLASDVNDAGVTSADHIFTYTFAKRIVKEDFNVITGEGSSYEEESELNRFIQGLKLVPLYGSEIAHGVRLDRDTRMAYSNNRYAAQQAPYGGQGMNGPASNNMNMNGGSYSSPSNLYDEELPFN